VVVLISKIISVSGVVVSGGNVTVRGGGVTVTGERRESRVQISSRPSNFFN